MVKVGWGLRKITKERIRGIIKEILKFNKNST